MPPKHIQLRDADLEPDRPTVGIGPHVYRLRLPIDLPPAQLSAIHRLSNALFAAETQAESDRYAMAVVPAMLYDQISDDDLARITDQEVVDVIENFMTGYRQALEWETRVASRKAYLGMRLIGHPLSRT